MRAQTFHPNVVRPLYRTYVPIENGPVARIGRTYKTLAACMKVAATLSRDHAWVEIKDDHLPINKRLLAVARKGLILDHVSCVDIHDVLQ